MEQALKAMRGARLMLYAWKGARQDRGLPDNHTELNNTIAELEAAIAECEAPRGRLNRRPFCF
jgi:hypothetical protein